MKLFGPGVDFTGVALWLTMERKPFEDVSPIENTVFPLSCQFSGG